MDKETYKVALEILNTFGDKSMRLKASQDLGELAMYTVIIIITESESQVAYPSSSFCFHRTIILSN